MVTEKKRAPSPPEFNDAIGAKGNLLDIIASLCERFVPDALTTSIILMILLAAMSVVIDVSDGLHPHSALMKVFNAYYDGFWALLAFAMQMTLILVLSLTLAETPFFKKGVIWLSGLPQYQWQVVLVAALLVGSLSYLNWGLSLALSPVIAIHFCKQAENKGIPVDFLWMMAILAGAGSVWQFGLSASGPLMMTAEDHFLVSEGIPAWPLISTIFTPAAFTMIGLFTVATVLTGIFFMPKKIRPISYFPESDKLAEEAISAEIKAPEISDEDLSIAKRIETGWITLIPLQLGLISWLYIHFVVRDQSLGLNSLLTIYLLACLVFHRTVYRFTTALQKVLVASWPIIILYHLYAGVAGLIQNTEVGNFITSCIEPVVTPYTFPFLIIVISSIVAIFLPSSGTQWIIQGLITVKLAETTGLSGQHGLLALSVGDHMGNLLTPFWAVVGAGIARVEFREFFGYRLIFAFLWFTIGVLIFTFMRV